MFKKKNSKRTTEALYFEKKEKKSEEEKGISEYDSERPSKKRKALEIDSVEEVRSATSR